MATLNDLLSPDRCGFIDDATVITVMRKDGRHIRGKWFEDSILNCLHLEARMIVYDGEKNALDIMI